MNVLKPLSARDLIAVQQRLGSAKPDTTAVWARVPRGFLGWSGREGDRPGGVAAGCLGECLGGIGEAVAGGDRDLQLPVSELLRQLAQLVSVGTDVDAGHRDAALAAPPGAALAAAAAPWRPVIARTWPGQSWSW